MRPRALDRDARRGGIDGIAIGRAADRHQHPIEQLRLGRIRALIGRAQTLCQRLELRHLGLQQNLFVALFDAFLQRPNQIAIGARHQAVA